MWGSCPEQLIHVPRAATISFCLPQRAVSQWLWVLQIKCGCDLRGLHVRTWSQVTLHSWILDQDDTWTLFYIRLIDHMDELKSQCSRYDYLTGLLWILSQRVFALTGFWAPLSPTNPHMNPAVWIVHLCLAFVHSTKNTGMWVLCMSASILKYNIFLLFW
jgi:hypothetical protein